MNKLNNLEKAQVSQAEELTNRQKRKSNNGDVTPINNVLVTMNTRQKLPSASHAYGGN